MADSEKLETEEFQNALDLFAEILGIGVGRQLKQGLYREYLDESEDTTMMHGRLNKVR